MPRLSMERFEPDYSGVGGYAHSSPQHGHGNYGNSKYLYPSNGNYMPGNNEYNRFDNRDFPSKSDDRYGNKYDIGNYDNKPTNPLGRVISNLLQTSQKENQRRVPVRDWSPWKYSDDDDVFGNYGYGHRGRRGATITMNDVLGKNTKTNRKISRSLHLDGSHIQPHHNYIEQMSLKEIKVKLQNTMEKVERIRERERNRRKQNSTDGNQDVEFSQLRNLKLESRIKVSAENVNRIADKSPSTLPNSAANVSLPVTDKYTAIFNSSRTNNLGVINKSSPVSKMEMNSTSDNESKATRKYSDPPANISSTGTGIPSESRTENSESQRNAWDIWGEEDIEDSTGKVKKKRRKKRHVGPHDEGGLQRLISTGAIELSFPVRICVVSVSVQYEHFHTILHNPFFVSLCRSRCWAV